MTHPLAVSKRRIFFGTGDESFQVLSVTQNKNDGSIYFASPAFADIEWRAPVLNADQQLELLSYQATGQDKLSLHASGVTHLPLTPSRPPEFRIPGNVLSSNGGENLGVRHLLTIFLSEPKHKPTSPALARKSDGVMTTAQWHPYVLVFWAVPVVSEMTITVKSSFNVDDLQEVPPNGGWGAFLMQHHGIVWFAYRTKHMESWPLKSQACYTDGYAVPLFIGTNVGEFRLEYRQPVYTLIDNNLTINL
ncbi:hypothetical protein [Pseudomonas chlororaphis]|uniref:hypothetical protein n=1 Tax=Pseudomonas chlororaphis TaxID=587753 RepID=UPI000F5859D1|nr:hypothetical protein [Pseudomonas chlororaphis]AZC95312.1 hypothetical protein C4K28_2584 [Pseudomonas chlororaphis subsp. piscium]